MKTKILALSLMTTILLGQPSVTLTQQAQAPDTDAWDVVQAIPVEAELEVVMKGGKKVRGRLLNVSDTALKLSRKDAITDLDKGDILKVYRLSPKSGEFRRLTRGIGATVGGGVGLAIGLSTSQRSTGRGAPAAILLIPVGTALGAVGGYLLGSRMKSRILVYESK